MKAFTERNPRAIGLAVVALTVAAVAAVLFLNRSIFESGYTVTARFPDAAGVTPGTDVLLAGVKVGTVRSVHLRRGHVAVALDIHHGVTLPHHTSAAIQVETLLGQLDVSLKPVSGWSRPLAGGAVIRDTSVPVELYDIQNEAGSLLAHTDAAAVNTLVTELESITKGKKQELQTIVKGLNRFTGVVDKRRSQVSQLIDAANTLSGAVATRDRQLASAIANLSTVVDGLAQHSTELGALIDNTQQTASQINTLVGSNRAQLTGLVDHLHSVLGVLSKHQLDLAQGVSTLASAVTGFSSVGYSGPRDSPNAWANIYTNLLGTGGVYGILGNCGALDQVLNEALGPDPLPCDQRSGPLATDGGATSFPSSSPASPVTSATGTGPTPAVSKLPGPAPSPAGGGADQGSASTGTGGGSTRSGPPSSGDGLLHVLFGGGS